MAYGYIPSPLGGRPSSVDIAKSESSPMEEYNSMRTPMGRARTIEGGDFRPGVPRESSRLETFDDLRDTRIADRGRMKSMKMGASKGRPYSAEVTPRSREMKQNALGDVPSRSSKDIIDDEHEDDRDTYGGRENLRKSEPPTGKERVSDAMRTPYGRVRATVNEKLGPENAYKAKPDDTRLYTSAEIKDREPQEATMSGPEMDANLDRLKDYEDIGMTPYNRQRKQAPSTGDNRGEEDFIPDEDDDEAFMPYQGIPNINKSENNPNEERNAMRTPYGRARESTKAKTGMSEPFAVNPDETRLNTFGEEDDYQAGASTDVTSQAVTPGRRMMRQSAEGVNRAPVETMDGKNLEPGKFYSSDTINDFVGNEEPMSKAGSDEDQIEVIDTNPPYYGRNGVNDSYKFKTIEGKKHDDATLGAMRTPRMKAEVTGGERLPDDDQLESYYPSTFTAPAENTPKGRDAKVLAAKLPVPWGVDSYSRQSSDTDEDFRNEFDYDSAESYDRFRDDVSYDSVRNDVESTRKSESSPVAKSINQMIYDRIYGKAPYSIKK